jgi:hypothetical protein
MPSVTHDYTQVDERVTGDATEKSLRKRGLFRLVTPVTPVTPTLREVDEQSVEGHAKGRPVTISAARGSKSRQLAHENWDSEIAERLLQETLSRITSGYISCRRDLKPRASALLAEFGEVVDTLFDRHDLGSIRYCFLDYERHFNALFER